MGNLFGGGESKSTTTQTYTANPQIASAAGQALGQAQSAASSPFNLPQQPVAGFSPLQQQAFNQYQAIQGYAQPYFDSANNFITQSGAPITGDDVNRYYNPMADKVFAAMNNAQGAETKRAMGSAISRAGGVGADRLAVTQANLAQKHELDTGATAANLYTQAMQNAQLERQRQLGAGQGLIGLGQTGFNTALTGTQALYGAGQQQQAQNQAELNAPYNLELQRQAFPYQQAQYLAGITGGLAPALGGTTNGQTTSTPAQPSIFSQLAGLGLGAAGMFMGMPGLGMAGGALGSLLGGSGSGGGTGMVPVGNYQMPTVGYNAYGYAEGGAVDDDIEIPGITGDPNEAPIPFERAADGGFMGGAPNEPDTEGYDPKMPIVRPNQSMWDFIKSNPIPGAGMFSGSGSAAAQPAAAGFPTAKQPAIPQGGGLPSVVPPPAAPRSLAKVNPQRVGASIPSTEGVDTYDAPQEKLPYPDSTERNAGQNLDRSPWLALAEAGFTMASTPGGIGTSLGKGALAGIKALREQRKELRSEEELNQKARALYMRAKEHLDQYSKMTPYQRQSLALRNRELDQNEGAGGGETSSRAFHARALQYYKLLKGDVNNLNKPDAELQARAYQMAKGAGTAASPGGGGDTPASAMPDPGPGGRVKGKWYIGPTGNPQQWNG